MKKTPLNQGMLVGMLLVASAASAQDYPAADFQPKVLFQDESAVAASSAAKSSAAAAPCVSQEAASKSKQEVAEVDPKYPASNFQPKVIFSEAN